MLTLFKKKPTESTRFSEFIRNASSEEKKKVYARVLKSATDQQNEVLLRHAELAKARR